MEIEKAAAFCDGGHAAADGGGDLVTDGVFTEGGGVKLGVAAGEIEALGICGEMGVIEGAEIGQLTAQMAQNVQIFLIEKAERLVSGHGDDSALCDGENFAAHGQRGGGGGQGKEAVNIQVFFRQIGKGVQAAAEVADLISGDEAQVAAADGGLRGLGQETVGLDPCRLRHESQLGVQHGGAAVEDDAADMALRAELGEALYGGSQRGEGTLGVHHQHHGGISGVGHMVGAGVALGADAVVVAHDALDDAALVGALAQMEAKLGRGGEKGIQILGADAQHPAMEHGVDVIGAAFIGLEGKTTAVQRPQQGAGDGGFAATGVGAGKQQTVIHGRHLRRE